MSDLRRGISAYFFNVFAFAAITILIFACLDPYIDPASDLLLVDRDPCPVSTSYQYLILNKTETYKSIEFQTRYFSNNVLESVCQKFGVNYTYVLRSEDFAYINDSVFFSPNDFRSSSPIAIIDSLGNHLFEALDGNGTYEIRNNTQNEPVLVKTSDILEAFNCDGNFCEKYIRPFDITIKNSRNTPVSFIADIFVYNCIITENEGVGACFPNLFSDFFALTFELERGEVRNFQHMADRIIILFENTENTRIELDARINPAMGGKVDIDITPDGVEVDFVN